MSFQTPPPNRRRMATRKPSSRADAVRTRRGSLTTERTEKKIQQVKQSSASVPVVTMRSSVMGTPVIQRTSSRPKLKLSLPLNSRGGVEMRLPAIPVLRPSWRILSGVLVIILTAVIIYLSTADEFLIKSPQIKGLNRLNAADLEAAMLLDGTRIFMVDPVEVKSLLASSFPELKDISVDVSLPAKVSVTVKERQPVITWKYQDVAMWIDNEGVVFPARGEAETLLNITSDAAPPMIETDVKPVLLDPKKSDSEQTEQKAVETPVKSLSVDRRVLNMAINLSKHVPANTTLVYNTTSGLGWLDANGWNVYIGFDLDQLDQKMLVYQKIVDTLNQQGLHPKVISVEYVNAPYYRLE
ncbi:MAG: FtsQ-type POTRA domain-containing protein [Anaerolineae bacterium]|nr:FtsQ-type POTRA domain-containing protein [Anaerolineae bacterium]